MSYNLRQHVKDYLKLTEEHLNWVFKNFSNQHIHMSVGATEKHFRDLENQDDEKRKWFGDYLIDKQ